MTGIYYKEVADIMLVSLSVSIYVITLTVLYVYNFERNVDNPDTTQLLDKE